MSKIILETERTFLRELCLEDATALREIWGDPEVMEFSLNGAEDERGIQKYLARTFERYEKEASGFWAVILKETNELVGVIGLIMQEVDKEKHMEIGYRLKKVHWKKGLATEVCLACRDYAFNELGKNYLISIIDPKNTNSIKVAERVGMSFEKEAIVWGLKERIYSIKRK